MAIARAIAKSPAVIIGDEPTASLDQKTGHEIMEILAELVAGNKTSVILTTHDSMVQSFATSKFPHPGWNFDGLIIARGEGNMWLILALRNLFRNGRRTIAVLFTVALGTGLYFLLMDLSMACSMNCRYDTIHSSYGYGQINTKGYRETVFEDPTKHWISNGEQVQEFLSHLDGVENVFPRVGFSALIKHGNTTVGGSGQGIRG